jgi:ubiquinone/menaquinone biosynthesis C-methylase UbiE
MTLRDGLYRLYWSAERLLVPGLRYSQSEYERVLDDVVGVGVDWLDVGCGHSLLPDWRREQEAELVSRRRTLVGIDLDLPGLMKNRVLDGRVFADAGALPFPDGTFDLVTANMVVEHLTDPLNQFAEIRRVLRPGGLFVFHTPNVRSYFTFFARLMPEWTKSLGVRLLEGRAEEDRFATHYLANSSEAISAAAKQTGFEVVRLEMICTTAVFAAVLPLALLELLWIRVLRTRRFALYRPNIIAVLQGRPAEQAGTGD